MAQDWLWWRDGVIYQIYPRSFADSNNDGIGDLNGITTRLDYLKDLGIDAIWLSPIYPSPNIDFGYDISNYTDIHPEYGSLADFDHLVSEAHQRGIRVVLDMVLNHTSDQHPWFQSARSSPQSPYRDWYLWSSAPLNNWQSVFGGSGWEREAGSGEYYFHMFYKEQPDLNWRNPQVRQAALDIFRFWMERGVDGFRLDVFNVYFKHPALPNNPPRLGLRAFDRQEHRYDIDQPEMIPLLQELRALLDSYPERYAVGETFLSTPEKAAQYSGDDRLHAAFNFEFLHTPWRAPAFLKSIQRWEHALSHGAWPNYVLNNHDVRRSASRYARGESDERLKMAAALLLTQRGTPFLYYGEEIGMRNIQLPRSQIKDRVGLRYWPLPVGRDGCRSPMQWDDTPQAGFSSTQPWLPVHPNYITRNVAAQQADPNSLYHFYQRLLHLRRSLPVLQQGMFLPLTYEPRWMLGYLRQTSEQTILVTLNFARFGRRLVLGRELAKGPWKLLLSNRRTTLPALVNGLLPLGGEEVCILQMENH